ncbi:MAG: polysaccharide biosynthesis tyrosine autokinase [Acidobacteria bacterium]|nr:polysaccharide biosynthesis tyrosine autokinase [Acidobacteriota bacterium]
MSPNRPPDPAPAPEHFEEVSLAEWLANLWDARWLILGVTALVLAATAFSLWTTTPIYQVEALLQIEEKKSNNLDRALAELDAYYSGVSQAQTEMEILRSALVLGRAAESLGLDIQARPVLKPVVGEALMRGRPDAPRIEVDSLVLPDALRGVGFRIVALEGGAFRWEAAGGQVLGSGKPGEQLSAAYQGETLRLRVRKLRAGPGQVFTLSRQVLPAVVAGLRGGLAVAERGRQTGVVGLTFRHPDPVRAAEILNEILNQYVRQNIERKSEEVSKTIQFLNQQLPLAKAKLDDSENRLNSFRMRAGSVDLPEETQLLLKQSLELESQMLTLKQKKDELLRIYKEDHDIVATLNLQLGKLAKQAQGLEGKVRGLPATQQEVVRLTREVQVNNQLYTAMLNNVQQLQVVNAGQIGNARVVDVATPALGPVSPNVPRGMTLALVLGLLGGVGVTMLRKLLHQAVDDPRQIEAKLGLPVFITIPHSAAQESLYRRVKAREEGIHLLAHVYPGDLATESFRSLRTTLNFTMVDAPNNVILVSGPSPHLGKSFFCANFATILAQGERRVLLVDADMRRGNLYRYFGLRQRPTGLSEILSGQADWKKVVHHSGVPGLDAIFTGALPPNPSELLMTPRFADLFGELTRAYDFVIFDAPPVLAATDAVVIGAKAGTVLLLAKSGEHPLDEIHTALKRFGNSGIQVKGCVFNNVPVAAVGYRYYRYAYHYGYK